MQLIPNRFLFRTSHPCPYVGGVPDDDEVLFRLPDECVIESFSAVDGKRDFAEIRLGWNEGGLAVEVGVRGKDHPPKGDASKPRVSDGLSLWIDTRDARTSHRASRYCHQFHLLPTGGGPERDEPAFVQTKIHRATQDAPIATTPVPLRCKRTARGWKLTAFLTAEVLTGFDPEQHPRWGIFYVLRDEELGEQSLGAATDLPVAEDPTLWSVLELLPKTEEGEK